MAVGFQGRIQGQALLQGAVISHQYKHHQDYRLDTLFQEDAHPYTTFQKFKPLVHRRIQIVLHRQASGDSAAVGAGDGEQSEHGEGA